MTTKVHIVNMGPDDIEVAIQPLDENNEYYNSISGTTVPMKCNDELDLYVHQFQRLVINEKKR